MDTSIIRAPWSIDQVESLNAFQDADIFDHYKSHTGEKLVATAMGWTKPGENKVVQEWAHTWCADYSWAIDKIKNDALRLKALHEPAYARLVSWLSSSKNDTSDGELPI